MKWCSEKVMREEGERFGLWVRISLSLVVKNESSMPLFHMDMEDSAFSIPCPCGLRLRSAM
eukprot:scaffold19794_cov207-Skeletonema_marinoi.AAC.1